MTTSRSFPRAVAAACAVVSLALGAAPAAHAALNPVWLDNATLADSGSETFNPRVASSHGRTVVVWKQSDGSNTRLYASLRGTDGSWSVPEPVSAAGQEVNYDNYRVAADADGDITVAWCQDSSGLPVFTRTLAKDSSQWADPQLLADSDGGWDLELSSRADGSMVAWYATASDPHQVRLRTMRPGSDTWDPTPADVEAGSNPSSLSVAYNASGDGIAVWAVHPDSNYQLRASRYDAATDRWSEESVPVTTPSAAVIEATFLRITPTGAATVLWGSQTDMVGRNASVEAGSDTWVTQDPLAEGDRALVGLGLASDRAGNIVVAYSEWDGSDMMTARLLTRTRDAATDHWSTPVSLLDDGVAGFVSAATVDLNGNILATMLTTTNFETVRVAALYRPDGATSFTHDQLGTMPLELSHGAPVGTLDDQGNAVVVWPKHGSGEVLVNAAIGDATGPELRGLTVPTSGTVGEPLSFSVSPFDLLSGLGTTSWNFGDNRDATGTSISHTYETPGTYQVTAASRDLNGQTSSETRTITIAARPVDEPEAAPEQPKVLAPVIEARLSGKTITLTARVTLRAGKKCSGKATATTRFGTTTYRTTLKLATVNGRCVGTGVIRLRKTPSTRKKLRITISAKHIKTRKVTTKR